MTVNVNLTTKSVIQIKNGIVISVNVSVKNNKTSYMQKILFGILAYVPLIVIKSADLINIFKIALSMR